MILVLCDEMDLSASWAAEALTLRGLEPMLLTGADLASIKQWNHKVGKSANSSCELTLGNGKVLHSHEIGALLNRLPSVPSAWLRSVGGTDREYAIQEMQAFYLSWLHALPCLKLNAPTPQGLCGNWRHPSVWTALAVRSGLPVRPYRQTHQDDPALPWQVPHSMSNHTVHVVGKSVVGPDDLVRTYGSSCVRLAQAAEVGLLGLDFQQEADGKWVMTKASVMPDLMCGGEPLVDALAGAMRS